MGSVRDQIRCKDAPVLERLNLLFNHSMLSDIRKQFSTELLRYRKKVAASATYHVD